MAGGPREGIGRDGGGTRRGGESSWLRSEDSSDGVSADVGSTGSESCASMPSNAKLGPQRSKTHQSAAREASWAEDPSLGDEAEGPCGLQAGAGRDQHE